MIYKDIQHTFNIFLKELWFSPHDALIRSHEAYLYSRIKINKPNIDIGCGNGKMTSLLFPSTTFDIGIDNNKLEVILAKNSKKYKRVLLRDATKIPAEDESINTIVSNCTLEHIKRDVVVIAEVGRVLKRGGNFIFTVPNIKFTHEIERNYGKNAFKSINDRLEHVHYRSTEEWNEILKQNNLYCNKRIEYISKKEFHKWYRLQKIYTYKLLGREIWHYIKNSKVRIFFPANVVFFINKYYVGKLNNPNTKTKGYFSFYEYIKK